MQRKLIFLFLVIFVIMIYPQTTFAQRGRDDDDEVAVTGVWLNQDRIELERNRTATLTATVLPQDATNREITWFSSDPAIAEVRRDGPATAVVTARRPGQAVITVRTADGNFQASCNVDVFIPISSLSFTQTAASIAPSEELILDIKVLPSEATDQRLEFSSSDAAIATVVAIDPDRTRARNPQVRVTARREGETRIVVRSVRNDRITAYFDLTVSTDPAPAPVETVDPVPQDPPPPEPAEPIGTEEPTEQVATDEDLLGQEETRVSEGPNYLYLYLGLGALLLMLLSTAGYLYRDKLNLLSSTQSIKAVSGHFAGQQIKLKKGQLKIGRDAAENQLIYPQSYSKISRKHCVLGYDHSTGSFTLTDSSSNGTFLATGERLISGKTYTLKPGERFYLADPKELFEIE